MHWYKIASASIAIDMSNYRKSLQNRVNNLIDSMQENQNRINNLSLDVSPHVASLQQVHYPKINTFINIVISKNVKAISKLAMHLFQWVINNRKKEEELLKSNWDYNKWSEINKKWANINNTVQWLWDLSSKFSNEPIYSIEEINNDMTKLLNESYTNMCKIADLIRGAISRINNWNGSKIKITANAINPENDWYVAETDASVSVGEAEFSIFNIDNNWVIDDIMEAGGGIYSDFTSETDQIDYFSLIQEIRHPGSTSHKGKIKTLYTARPIKDRKLYEGAQEVPAGLFLTENIDFATYFGDDYNEKRDVWKIRIDSRYLIQTNNAPGNRQYQIVGTGMVPVKKMELIIANDEDSKQY